MDIEKVVKAFIKIRDTRSANKAVFDEQDRKLKEDQELLANMLLDFLNKNGLQNVSTEGGIVYKQESITPTGADWGAFYDFIKKNDAFEALEKRIKVGFIKEYMDAHDGGVPPGVSVYRSYEAKIRRK